MPQPKYLASTILIILVGILILTTAAVSPQAGANQQKDTRGVTEETPDFSRFPIVDFYDPEPLELNEKKVRETKGRRYTNKYLGQISEDTHQIFSIVDWDVGLPAFPVERSAAVVIGKVRSARAYLTPDKTGIYSEFTVAIDTIVKNDADNIIKAEDTITVERNGGRARMPSGKLVLSWVNHQNMPRVGGRYLLFLTNDLQTPEDTGKDFYILTGYELRDGQVHMLDDTQPNHPITRYKGKTETTLLTDLYNTVAKTSNLSN